jgi:hypothetical protein
MRTDCLEGPRLFESAEVEISFRKSQEIRTCSGAGAIELRIGGEIDPIMKRKMAASRIFIPRRFIRWFFTNAG